MLFGGRLFIGLVLTNPVILFVYASNRVYADLALVDITEQMNFGHPNHQALAAAPKPKTICFNHCVVFAGDGSDPGAPIIAGGNRFGAQGPPIRATTISSRYPHTSLYVGFGLRFPLPPGQFVNQKLDSA